MAPLTRARAGEEHIANELMAEYYAQRAGGGLLIAEATMAMEGNSAFWMEPGIYSDEQVEGWKLTTEAVHAAGGNIFLQVWHGGRACHPLLNDGAQPVAPSALRIEGEEVHTPEGKKPYVTPRELGDGEIPGLVAGFKKAAENAKAAGFDGIEIHGANGYLIDEFLRDGSNKRTGPYGGSLENRCRFLFEILEAVTGVFDSNQVGLRISPLNSFNSMSDSDPLALVTYLAKRLSKLDLAYLHVMRADFAQEQEGDVLTPVREHYTGTIVANMGYGKEEAEEQIASGLVDAVAFGVPFLANPDLPARFKAGAPLNDPDPGTFYTPGPEVALDKAHCWHPFTRQEEWCAAGHQPIMISRAEGVWLYDESGNKYLDGNSSIWTNIHGHCRPEITAAIARQAGVLDHSSYLGLGHPLASELAAKLVSFFPEGTLERVFFSDNGSTAVEAALKMSLQSRMQTNEGERVRFLAFDNAYHGDTLGAASLGGVNRFFSRFEKLGFETQFLSSVEDLEKLDSSNVTGLVIEPLIQGVNEMRPWPAGMLKKLREWTAARGIHLILDEVMTGFGRTGAMFACQREEVIPDFLCVAKGLTGGTVPLAATLTSGEIYSAFLGPAENAFYYGHSYTANPIGCAAALASLDIFEREGTLEALPGKIDLLAELLAELRNESEAVVEIRQCGLVAGVQLREGLGEEVIRQMRSFGVITRNILDTIVVMPPLCITREEITFFIRALRGALAGMG
eukprot:g4220.t1